MNNQQVLCYNLVPIRSLRLVRQTEATKDGIAAAPGLSSSFRDPAGFVFREEGLYKRAITFKGQADYDLFLASGLYEQLAGEGLILPHAEEAQSARPGIYKTIVPEQLPYISYPYEWSFEQLKDAALLTLRIQEAALKRGLSLKDASFFNIQFRGSRPVFIDTLSFENNIPGPWVAYNQFCRHFLSPLLLMAYVSPSFNQYLKASLDGFSLDLASAALPWRTYLRFGPLLHLHLHARTQKKHADTALPAAARSRPVPDRKAVLADSLASTVSGLRLPKAPTEWINYYRDSDHYSSEAQEVKQRLVSAAVERVRPRLVYDLGGNIGTYSRLVTATGIPTVCYDIDPLCVNENYLRSKANRDRNMLPLLTDLTNPSPPLGFGLAERYGFLDRSKPDLVLALAVIHHLRMTGNIPLTMIADFLGKVGKWLLIEFVPKEDPMAQKILSRRPDIFEDYDLETFGRVFEGHFALRESAPVSGTKRTMCLFENRS